MDTQIPSNMNCTTAIEVVNLERKDRRAVHFACRVAVVIVLEAADVVEQFLVKSMDVVNLVLDLDRDKTLKKERMISRESSMAVVDAARLAAFNSLLH